MWTDAAVALTLAVDDRFNVGKGPGDRLTSTRRLTDKCLAAGENQGFLPKRQPSCAVAVNTGKETEQFPPFPEIIINQNTCMHILPAALLYTYKKVG